MSEVRSSTPTKTTTKGEKMSDERVKLEKRYRIYYWSGRFQQFANRLGLEDSPPRVRWSPSSTEYPDHFSEEEMESILRFYSDQYQILKVTSVYVAVGVEDDEGSVE